MQKITFTIIMVFLSIMINAQSSAPQEEVTYIMSIGDTEYSWSDSKSFSQLQIDSATRAFITNAVNGTLGLDSSSSRMMCMLDVDCSNIVDMDLDCRGDLPSVDFDLPIINDACPTVADVIMSALTIIPGNSGCPGDVLIIPRTYFIQDTGGNMAQCDQTFTIESTNGPTLTPASASITEVLDANCEFALLDYRGTVTLTSDCTSPAITQSPAPGTIISGATTTVVTFSVTDFCGRTTSADMDIVTEDMVAPTVICVAPFTAQLDAMGMVTIVAADIDNGSTDACGIADVSIGETGVAFAEVVEGQNLTITVPVGMVINSVDFASYGTPTGSNGVYALGTCHAANSVAVVEGLALGNNSFTIPASNGTFGDPCFGTPKRLFVAVGYGVLTPDVVFTCNDIGDNDVTITVTDVNGNTATCTTTITVEDTVAPAAMCVAPFTVQLDAMGMASITVADIENGSTDACGIASTSIDVSSFNCTNVGDNTVTLTVTDNNMNVSTCTTIVTVADTVPINIISGPIDIFTGTGASAGDCGAIVTYDPITVDDFMLENNCGDNSSITIVQTAGLGSGSLFPVGVTAEEYTLTDANGNDTVYTFSVTISDTTLPVIDCPSDLIVSDGGTGVYAIEDYTTSATDNCSSGVDLVVTQDPVAGTEVATLSTTTVTVTATDAAGNVTECVFDILVDGTLGVEDALFNSASIHMYPNPTNGELNIVAEIATIDKVEVYDLSGRLVKRVSFDSNAYQFNLSDVEASVYLVQIYSGTNVVTKRVVKN